MSFLSQGQPQRDSWGRRVDNRVYTLASSTHLARMGPANISRALLSTDPAYSCRKHPLPWLGRPWGLIASHSLGIQQPVSISCLRAASH